MEFAEKGSLNKQINKREMDKEPFSEEEIMTMFANIAFSLLEVNTRGIFHRDLKPDNMLI
jgi:NIMA (never in mitosis gene a)-related kinase 1/4/5